MDSLPGLLPENSRTQLQIQIRYHQTSATTTASNESIDVATYWSAVKSTGRVPLLVSVAKAVFILPHGNAEVERIFSCLNDTVSKKRNRISGD